jgi:hypothetical protein
MISPMLGIAPALLVAPADGLNVLTGPLQISSDQRGHGLEFVGGTVKALSNLDWGL